MDNPTREQIKSGLTHGGMSYHAVPEMGIAGRRNNEHRAKQLNIGDLTGQTVLDIGCNSGWWCDYVVCRCGADFAIGIDKPETILSAEAISHDERVLLCARDMALPMAALPEIPAINTILYLSMVKLLGVPQYLSIADHVIIENNNAKFEDYIMDRMKRIGFLHVQHCGYTEDFGKRSIIKAWK